MRSIYRRAKGVIAWVGEEDVSSAIVMDLVAPLSDLAPLTRSVPNHRVEARVKALISFLERPYWRRVWIIQELALAKGTMVHCGGRQMRWSQLVGILDSLEEEMICSDCSEKIASKVSEYPAIINARNLTKFQQDASRVRPIRFLEALKRSSSALSTDPRTRSSHY